MRKNKKVPKSNLKKIGKIFDIFLSKKCAYLKRKGLYK